MRIIVVLLLIATGFSCSNPKRTNPLDPGGENWHPPTVVAMNDTFVAINDSFSLHAIGTDTNGTVRKYLWALDGVVFRDSTDSGRVRVAFATAGVRTILVRVLDNDGISSAIDTVKVTVHSFAPTVVAMNDTSVAIEDSFYVHATGNDTNGTIQKYLWALDGLAFRDSTDSGRIKAAFVSAGVKTVLVRVLDDDGMASATDTVKVTVGVAPSITSQPQSQTVTAGQNVIFSVTATGTSPLSYQWYKNGAAVSGAMSSNYAILNVQAANAGTYTVMIADGILPNATSNGAILTVNPPPVAPSITSQPQSQSVIAGQNVTFSVTATGTAPLSYQWYLNGSVISGATSSNMSIVSALPLNAGVYTVIVVNNASQNATSNGAVLTVSPAPGAPSITSQPQSQTVAAGSSVTFSVTATGNAPFLYQWYKNGAAISGATTSSISILSVQAANAGTYTVTVSNGALPNATSNGAILTVN
jgi:Immunoglobulin domain/PKD domain